MRNCFIVLFLMTTASAAAQLSNDDCLACQERVDARKFAASVHAPLECLNCHADIKAVPHETPPSRSIAQRVPAMRSKRGTTAGDFVSGQRARARRGARFGQGRGVHRLPRHPLHRARFRSEARTALGLYHIAYMTLTREGRKAFAISGVATCIPRWWIDIATTIHFYEVILATLAILVWHFYHVIFDPDVYPMNWAWDDGKMSEGQFHEEHPLSAKEQARESNQS